MRWSDCRTEAERRAALLAALRDHQTGEDQARALGIRRSSLYRILARYGTVHPAAPDPSVSGVRHVSVVSAVSAGDSDSERDAPNGHHGRTVSATDSGALTYGGPIPTFRRVSSVVAVTEGETLTLGGIPKPIKDWLQSKALKRMQSEGGRFAVSPVVVEILERAMAEEENGGGTE